MIVVKDITKFGFKVILWSTSLSFLLACTESNFYSFYWYLTGKLSDKYLTSISDFLVLYLCFGVALGVAITSVVLAASVIQRLRSSNARQILARILLFGCLAFVIAIALLTHHLEVLSHTELRRFLGSTSYVIISAVCFVVAIIVERWVRAFAHRPRLQRAVIMAAALYGVTTVLGALYLQRVYNFDKAVAEALAGLSETGTGLRKPNILLITIDSLRADHMGVYGYRRAVTRNIDVLAAESVVFDNMVAQSPWTRSSFGSIWTALYPYQHEANRRIRSRPQDTAFDHPLRKDVPTIAELLTAAGYTTVGLNTNANLDPVYGFDRGFKLYFNALFFDPLQHSIVYHVALRYAPWLIRSVSVRAFSYLPAESVTRSSVEIVRNLESSGNPFFLWVHLMDPHLPYYIRNDVSGGITQHSSIAWNDAVALRADEPAGREILTRYYDSELSYVDEHVGGMLSQLKELGILEDTIVVLTSDHGEELFDHSGNSSNPYAQFSPYFRGFDHGHTMYDELTRIPLLMRFPHGKYAGERVQSVVQHVDLLPTLLAAASIRFDERTSVFEGISVMDCLSRAHPWPHRFAYSEFNLYGSDLKQIRSERFKLIYHTADHSVEFYDLLFDRAEKRNLAVVEGQRFRELQAELQARMAEAQRSETGYSRELEGGPVDTPAEQLRSLGYVH